MSSFCCELADAGPVLGRRLDHVLAARLKVYLRDEALSVSELATVQATGHIPTTTLVTTPPYVTAQTNFAYQGRLIKSVVLVIVCVEELRGFAETPANVQRKGFVERRHPLDL
jgi:hypothetical protein